MSRQIFLVSLFFGLTLLGALTAACDVSPLSSIMGSSVITDAVLAKDFKSDSGTPVDVTTEYAPEQRDFHLVVTVNDAPKDTKFKSVWTAVDIGGITLPNTKLEEHELIVTGSGTFEFTLTLKTGKWAAGKYKVDLYTNNKFDRTLNFTVAGTIAARVPTATPTKVSCPEWTPPPFRPSGLISKVSIADKIDTFGNAVNPTTTLKPTTRIYAVVSYKNVPANSRVRLRWWAVDVGTTTTCNTTLEGDDHTIGQTGTIALYAEKQTPFLVGTYRVDVYLNDKLDQVVNFSVTP